MKICDSHTDFLTAITSKSDRDAYVKSIKEYGASTISCAVFTTELGLGVKDIANYFYEIEHLKRKYGINLLFSIEDLGFATTDSKLEQIINLKPFSTTLTWNYDNQFAGGADSNQGLTSKGKDVVKLLESNNILIDTAHLSRKAFYDFCKITKFPIYNSHSNIYTLKSHKRNLTDKQIKLIVESGGYLGITIYDKFVSKHQISSYDIALQFDYLIKNFGSDNFGLGTDLFGINENNLPTDINGYHDISKLTSQLAYLGYSKNVINKIIYKNFDNFLNKLSTI